MAKPSSEEVVSNTSWTSRDKNVEMWLEDWINYPGAPTLTACLFVKNLSPNSTLFFNSNLSYLGRFEFSDGSIVTRFIEKMTLAPLEVRSQQETLNIPLAQYQSGVSPLSNTTIVEAPSELVYPVNDDSSTNLQLTIPNVSSSIRVGSLELTYTFEYLSKWRPPDGCVPINQTCDNGVPIGSGMKWISFEVAERNLDSDKNAASLPTSIFALCYNGNGSSDGSCVDENLDNGIANIGAGDSIGLPLSPAVYSISSDLFLTNVIYNPIA